MAETKLQEFREQYPQYDDLSDRELAEGLHRKHYSDMEFETFAERIGLQQQDSAPEGDVEIGEISVVDRAMDWAKRDDAPSRGDGSRYGEAPDIDWQGRPGGESARRQTEQIRAEREARPEEPAGAQGERRQGLGLTGIAPRIPGPLPASERLPGDGGGMGVGSPVDDRWQSMGTMDRTLSALERGFENLGVATDAVGVMREHGRMREAEQRIERYQRQLEDERARILERYPNAPEGQVDQALAPIRERIEREREIIAETQQRFVERAESLRQGREDAAAIPSNPTAEAAMRAESFEEFWQHFSSDPLGVIGQIGTESLPLSLPGIGAGVVGGAAGTAIGGPVGGAAGFSIGMGAGSGSIDYAMSLAEGLEEHGADLSDPESVRATIEEHGDEIKERAFKRGVAIGLFDALGGRIAASRLVPRGGGGAVSRSLDEATEAVAQLGAQAATGSAGEASAQLATGEELRPGEIAAEGVGELITAPVEVAGATASGVRGRGDADDGRPLPDDVFDADTAARMGEQLRRAQAENRPVELTGPDDTVMRGTPDGEVGTERQFNEQERARQQQDAGLGLGPDVRRAAESHPGRARPAEQAPAEPPASEPASPRALPAPDRTLYGTPEGEVGSESDVRRRGDERREMGLDEVRGARQGRQPAMAPRPQGAEDSDVLRRDNTPFRSEGDARLYAQNQRLEGYRPVEIGQGQWALRRMQERSPEPVPSDEEIAQQESQESIRKRITDLERARGVVRGAGPRQAIDSELERLRKQEAEEQPKLTPQQRAAARRTVDPGRDDLATAIRKLGGIDTDLENDWSGRLTHVGADPVPGLPKLERPGKGRSLDDLAEALHEEGYLQSRDATELADRLEQVEMGVPVYSNRREQAQQERDAREAEAARNMGAELEPETADLDEIMAAWDEYAQQEGAPGEQYEPDAYDPQADEVHRVMTDVARAAQDVDADAVEAILERAARDGTPDADVIPQLLDVVRGGQRDGAQSEGVDRPRADEADAGQAEAGTEGGPAAEAESEQELTLSQQEAPAQQRRPREQQEDAFGGKSEGQQAQVDADARRRQREADAPPAETEEGLFSGGERQVDIDEAANQAATSPTNDTAEPTDGQKEAGNYKVGRVRINGLDISIENPAGSRRRPEWPPLKHHYGYIRGTEGRDGDHVDVFLTDQAADDTMPVFVVDQVDPQTRRFDEHKVMLGFADEQSARQGYLANYQDGWQGLGNIRQFTLPEFKAWLEQGNTKRRVTRQNEVIDDFGETLHGARKHLAQEYADRLGRAEQGDVVEQTLTEAWPEPNYQAMIDEGVDPWVVAFIHAARDSIPPKPRKGWKLSAWAESVRLLRDFSKRLASGDLTKQQVQERMDSTRGLDDMKGVIDLYQAVGHEKSLKGLRLEKGQYSVWMGERFDPPKVLWTVERRAKSTAFGNMPRIIARGDTKQEAIEAFKQKYAELDSEQGPARRQVRFDVYGRRGQDSFFIGKKIGKDVVPIADGFTSANDARAYLRENQAELERRLERMKDIPDHRKQSNAPRVGYDHRAGGDVTPDAFSEAFGFRGVQFGNYVEGGRRQQDLNNAYDALMDLAGILNVPPRALSLNGELGLAFGARGKGGKGAGSAHYEPDTVVINLTKQGGPGSLAHEWWHALDNYFSRRGGRRSGFLTEGARQDTDARPEVQQAFRDLVQTINRTGLKERSRELDKVRTKEYWGTGREMSARAFESYVIAKLQDQSLSNDYLANILPESLFEREGSYPYPTAAEIPQVRAAFDNLFQTVETRETESGVEVFSRTAPRGADAMVQAEDAKRVAESLMRDWAGAPPVSIVQSESQLPEGIQRAIDAVGAQGEIRGIYWRGRAYVVSDNLRTPAEIEETLLHEIVGHHGLREIMGDDFTKLLDDVYLSVGRRGLAPIAEEYGFDLNDKTQRRQAAEEHLAHIAQTNPQSKLWDRFVRMFTAALRRLGFRIRLTSAEIRDLLLKAKEFARTGEMVRGTSVIERHRVYRGTEHKEAVYNRRGEQYASLRSLVESWRKRGVEARVSERAGIIRLNNVTVRADLRGDGLGSRFMEALTRYADETGQRIGLTPEGDFGSDPARLREWYRRFGFRENKGRARDFEIMEAMVREPQEPAFQRVFHGTPHRFDRFSLDAIGTGEGAQAYGWGLYFAGRREVAEFYRDNVASGGVTYQGEEITTLNEQKYPRAVQLAAQAVREMGRPRRAVRALRQDLRSTPAGAPEVMAIQEAIDLIEGGEARPSGGALYQANIPEDNELLDWDAPFSEQPPSVKSALEKAGYRKGMEPRKPKFVIVEHEDGTLEVLIDGGKTQISATPDRNGEWYSLYGTHPGRRGFSGGIRARAVRGELTEKAQDLVEQRHRSQTQLWGGDPAGRLIYFDLVRQKGSSQKASQYLNDLGIPGLRYLDAGSRDEGEGSRNYVIWDENAVTVEAVNDELVQAEEAEAGEPMFSRRRRRRGGDIDPVLAEALKRAGLGKKRGPLGDWTQHLEGITYDHAKTYTREMNHALAQGALDRFHGIKLAELKYAGNLPAEQSAYVAARLSTGVSSTMRAILHHGAPEWRDGIISRVEGSKGLLEVLDPVRGDLETFLGWMVGRRAKRLMDEGRENLFEPEHIDALIRNGENSRYYDQFEATAAELDAFKKRILDVAEEAGLLDPDTRGAWDNADYIPFYRVAESESVAGPRGSQALSGQTSGIRTLKGGTAQLNDPLENLLMNFTHLMDASMKNHAIRQVRRNLDGSGVLEQVPPDFKQEFIPLEQVKARIREQGGDPRLLPPEALRGMAKLWAMKPPSDPDVVRIMEGGKAVYYRVKDPMLLRSLTAVRAESLNFIGMGVLRGFKRVLTRGVTADPAFMARNFLRDTLHAWTISEDKFRMGVDSIRGVTKTLKEKGGAIDMMFAGGSFLGGYVNANDPGETARAMRSALREKGYDAAARDRFMSTVIDSPLKWWEVYTRVGDAVENASREAVYEAAQKAGKSRAQAIFEAKDLMDYSMRGDHGVMQFFADTVPFLNARIQGLYKLGREGALRPRDIVARGSVIALASLALLARNWDDERYEDLEEWDKDTYWHIFLPAEEVGENLSHVRIPKPFEIGVLFGTIPERIARNMLGRDDTQMMYERFLWSIRETFAMSPVPQALAPVLEVMDNKNWFTTAPIEGMADQGKLPEARYNAYTSATMRALGRLTGPTVGVSPKQLEHLWRGYTGSLGMYALDAADLASRALMDMPPRPSMRIDDMPVVRSFLRAEPARSTKYLTEFYDLHEEVNEIYRTVRAYAREGNREEALALAESNKQKLAVRPALTNAASRNSDIRKAMEKVYRSRDLSPDEKRELIDELMARRNENTKEVMQSVDRFFREEREAAQ